MSAASRDDLLAALSSPAAAYDKQAKRFVYTNAAAEQLDLDALLQSLDLEKAAQEVEWRGQRVLVDVREGLSTQRPTLKKATSTETPLLSRVVHPSDKIMPTDSEKLTGAQADQIERTVWHTLLEAIPACAIIISPEGETLYISKTASSAFSLESNRDWIDHTTLPEGLAAHHDNGRPYEPSEYPIRRCLEHHEIVRGETMTAGSGKDPKMHLRVTASPVYKARTDQVLAIIAVIEDVTHFVQAEEEHRRIQAENEANKRINALKDTFTSQISHELRTPINGLLGLTHLLPTAAADERDELLVQLRTVGDDLAVVIENLLTLQGLTSYVPEPVISSTAVTDLIDVAIATQTRYLSKRPNAIHINIADDVPPRITCDPRLSVALTNLLNNAFRFSNSGTPITVSASIAGSEDVGSSTMEKDEEAKRFVVFVVTDEGEGIDSDHDVIFEAYRQGGAGEKKHAGAGVGLTVARGLLRANSGDVRIKSSAKGQGTSMMLYFPLVCPDGGRGPDSPAVSRSAASGIPLHRTETPPPTGKIKILAVDDEPVNLHIIRRALERGGYEVLTAVNGEEAISSFDTTIKLIIMDLMMPVLDGLEATRRIRKLDGGSSVAICAFTASSATETHAAAQALGMKPAAPRQLLAVVESCLAR